MDIQMVTLLHMKLASIWHKFNAAHTHTPTPTPPTVIRTHHSQTQKCAHALILKD